MSHLLLPYTISQLSVPIPKAGLTGWFKADAGVYSDAGTTIATDGQTVQQWNDFSAAGNNASQATGGLRPTFRANVNGAPALQFVAASNNVMTAGGNGDFASQQFTAFAVYEQISQVNDYPCVLYKGNGSSIAGGVWSMFAGTVSTSFNIGFETLTGGATDNLSDCQMGSSLRPELVCIKRPDNNTKQIYRNGVLISSGGDSGASLNAGSTPLGIGNDAVAHTHPANVYVREILYYSRSLSAQEQQAVEAYLRNKWLVAYDAMTLLTVSGPYPTNGMIYRTSPTDGSDWIIPQGVTDPVFTFTGPGGIGTSSDTQTLSCIFYQNKYWIAYEYNDFAAATGKFGIASASSLAGPWTFVTDVVIYSSLQSNCIVWNPIFFFDDDGSVHITLTAQNNADPASPITGWHLQLLIIDALNTSLTSWSASTTVSGASLPINYYDGYPVTPNNSPNGKYNFIYYNVNTGKTGRMSSAALKSGYAVDVADMGQGFEQPVLKKMPGGIWRWFGCTVGQDHSWYMDSRDWVTWSNRAPTSMPGDGIVIGNGSIGGAVANGVLPRP